MALNLEALAERPGLQLHLSNMPRADFRAHILVYDSLGNPRSVWLHWTRETSIGKWYFSAWVSEEDAASSPRVSIFDVIKQGSGFLQFDADGLLVGSAEIPVKFKFSGDVDPEQEIIFSFQSERGATTQLASASMLFHFGEDGRRCPAPVPSLDACGLSRSLARHAKESPGEALAFDANGVMLSTTHERVQGRRFDLLTGELEQAVADARIPAQLMPAAATQHIGLDFALDEFAPIQPTFDPRFQNAD